MKTLKIMACAAVLALMSGVVFATDNGGDQNGVNSKSKSQSQTSGSVANDSHDSVRGSDMGDMVGAAIAPALTTTLTETCMGSTSIGAGWSGGGVSFGTTWRDSACVRRLDAREVKSIHPNFAVVAKEIMCASDHVYEAFKRAGIPCVDQDALDKKAKKKDTAAVTQSSPKKNVQASTSNGFF